MRTDRVRMLRGCAIAFGAACLSLHAQVRIEPSGQASPPCPASTPAAGCSVIVPTPVAPRTETVVVAPAVPTSANIDQLCPTRVAPFYPRAALMHGISGVVKVKARIVDGVVAEVIDFSGPRIFYPSVAAALSQYKCASSEEPLIATQAFTFKVEIEPAPSAASQTGN